MNKLKISTFIGALLVILSGCVDEDLAPIITFDSAGKGAYARFVSDQGSTLVNLLEAESASSYTYTVEFVDLEQGNLVAEYVLELIYNDNDPDNGDNSSGPSVFKSFSPSDFTTNDKGLKEITVNVTAAEMTAAAGTTFDALSAGDEFTLDGRVVLQDGSQFGRENSSATVNGSAFRGFFDITFNCNCPSDLTGSYAATSTDIWCGAPDQTTTVTIDAQGGGVYKFSDWAFGSYACYGGGSAGGDLTFTDVCTEVSFTGFIDSFGDTWTYNSTINGNLWTIAWENTYGESATSVVEYPSGDWPITLK